MREITLWTRTHKNGWTAIVSKQDDGTFHAGAHYGGLSGVHWGHRLIDAIEPAQAIADGAVAEHACDCEGWFAAIPVEG